MRKLNELRRLYRYWQEHPLASRDLGGTVSRFVRWQVASRLLGAPVVWPWISGTKLVVETGMTGATMNIYCGLHEFADMAFVLHCLRPGDHFVDVGANVGSYTVLAAGVVGATVTCVEPIPATFQKLERNIAVNRIQNLVTACECGVGSHDGATLRFIADRDTTNQVAPADYSGPTVDVPVRSLDSLLAGQQPLLWKVDVEGFEEAVLQGAVRSLAQPALLAIEMEGSSPRISETLTQAGFGQYGYDPFTRKLTAASGQRDSHNTLWIRDLAEVARRCESAPAFAVSGISV